MKNDWTEKRAPFSGISKIMEIFESNILSKKRVSIFAFDFYNKISSEGMQTIFDPCQSRHDTIHRTVFVSVKISRIFPQVQNLINNQIKPIINYTKNKITSIG